MDFNETFRNSFLLLKMYTSYFVLLGDNGKRQHMACKLWVKWDQKQISLLELVLSWNVIQSALTNFRWKQHFCLWGKSLHISVLQLENERGRALVKDRGHLFSMPPRNAWSGKPEVIQVVKTIKQTVLTLICWHFYIWAMLFQICQSDTSMAFRAMVCKLWVKWDPKKNQSTWIST
jgi:hypothetical protein